MTETAWLFPGQASQIVGMGKDLYENTKIGYEYFNIANEIMKCDIKNIIFNGPDEELRKTQFTQPSIYIVSVILGEILLEKGLNPHAVAGHSLGEYSALTIAKSLDFKTGLELVKVRSQSMADAGKEEKGTMAAIEHLVNRLRPDTVEAKSAPNFDEKHIFIGQLVLFGFAQSHLDGGVSVMLNDIRNTIHVLGRTGNFYA